MRRVVSPCVVVMAVGMVMPLTCLETACASNVAPVMAPSFSEGQAGSAGGAQSTGMTSLEIAGKTSEVKKSGLRSIPQRVCLERGVVFVLLPPGEFSIGSREDEKDRAVDEGPILRVQISRPFWIGKYEVTQREWTAIMGENPSAAKSGGDHPVENVSWEDCQRFIERLNKISSRRFRLPTEAEWEYACRAGGETVYCSGDTLSDLARCAWYEGNSTGAHHPVGQKDPNVWGLYDMHGNVYEWCQDFYRNTYSGRSGDGVAWEQPDENGNRVRRGGSYQQPSKNCRTAFRGTGKPESRRGDVGLRLVMEE